jgi:ribokinase
MLSLGALTGCIGMSSAGEHRFTFLVGDQRVVADKGIFVLASFVAAFSAKVQRLPAPGESLCAESFLVEAGGKGFNIAAGARRLGAEVDGLLAVGDDLFSQLAETALTNAGLPRGMLLRQPGATGAGVGFIDAQGENCIAVFPGANALLSASHIADAAARLAKARLVIAQYEIGDEPIKAAFAVARRANCLTILNPSPYRKIDPLVLSQTDVMIVNRVEASRLGRDLGMAEFPEAPDFAGYQPIAQNLLDAGLRAVIVTLGAAGLAAWRPGLAPVWQPAFNVEVVDTIGAGDAFTAGFATALTENLPFEDCLRWGAAAGACTAMAFGVLDALPLRSALHALLDGA